VPENIDNVIPDKDIFKKKIDFDSLDE